ncbi:conserved oligomeric Golgi complex subunit 3-like protein [Sarcoptes scabiei]|uniref:Conserved oligomeric Golgi complex subunit 3 n=1 Tax=Sarcoptes scabiei TaxID=52283 RepID=A0A132A2G1_SARSC|nr:conserved oligomeric Golgi complex subunit 3-like protein [Sarcoptes scabiei]
MTKDSALDISNKFDEKYLTAVDKTKSFYGSCDHLLQQQHNLIVAIETFHEKLSYFEDFDAMSKKFTSPTMLILNESLLPLLKRLDECIEFMSINVEHYLEANHYLDEYQKFQLSALFTIRTHVINTLKQTAQQVMPENDSVLTSNDSVFTLYYGKFQINAHRIKTLMQQIEHRTKKSETPVSGDLAYPEKLEMMKSISDNLTTDKDNEVMNNEKSKSTMRRSDSVSSIISSVSDISFAQGYQSSQSRIVSSKAVADLHGMWYPTVRSSIMCLSKLYRTLDRTTFQSLSQEVLLACVDSLQVAFDLIKIKKSPLDGFLFIIKYLLIIREQITPFQIDTSIKEVFLDFTPTKTAVFDLIQNRTNLFSLTSNNALLKLIFEGTPQVSEKVIDSQKAVDNKIKEKCEEFIEYSYEYLTKELEKIIFVTQFNSIDNESKDLDDFNLRMSETFKDFLKKKELLQQKMSLYLVNTETEAIIFKQIDSKIQNLFGKLQKILNAKLANFEIVEKKQIPSIKDLID